MTAHEFAANLRAEMGRQGLPNEGQLTAVLCDLLGKESDAERVWDLLTADKSTTLPTPAEITALATALGCPEKRLTVSREELERRLDAAEHQLEAALASEGASNSAEHALWARVAELEADRQTAWATATAEGEIGDDLHRERDALRVQLQAVREWLEDTDMDDPKSRRRGRTELREILNPEETP